MHRAPDITEDPREQGTAQGYPETNPAELTPVEGTERGPEAANRRPDAPQGEAGAAEEPVPATGNPHAAGGHVERDAA